MPFPDAPGGRPWAGGEESVVPAHNIDNTEGAGYRRLNRRCMLSMYIGYTVSYAILLVAYFLLEAPSQGFLGSYYGFAQHAIQGLLLIALIYIVAAPPVYYMRYRYQITEDRVDVRYGILVIRHILVPIERVHQVEVSRGPINTLLGLADVTITTAGGVATINYLEIAEAEKVAVLLNDLVGKMLKGRISCPDEEDREH